ncbi:cytochrome P450 [Nocardioides sp. LS1]|uniref:cytochrome P450 n=1 Tax=Nocardioides sp. LS1 TaxID=1027620 RepID=UPI000F6200CA|nr:cytochrome P450 [Nocardioides sp. LS1]GCD88116.1 methyl-branched lipid omega-hydroxylase [Nocardioides sp. LS1]
MTTHQDLPSDLTVADPALWADGPPHETFAQLRAKCPVHHSPRIPGVSEESGFWSVTKADDIRKVSLDWKTFSSNADGAVDLTWEGMPEHLKELQKLDMINLDPPRHDRLKQLFLAGFTHDRILAEEHKVLEAVTNVLDRLAGKETCDLVNDISKPIVARVIHGFMGIPEEDDARWIHNISRYIALDDPHFNPGGLDEWLEVFIPDLIGQCVELVEQRKANPGDDLISILINAEVEGDKLDDEEIIAGMLLLFAAGNDSTMATFTSAMIALIENPGERQKVLDEMSLVPSVVEEALRMFPAFTLMRRTAVKDVELNGAQIKEGDSVVLWYPSANRDEDKYDDPHRFDVTRNPEHQAFGAGGRHFCLGNALARLELRVMIAETLKRYPQMEIAGEAPFTESYFVNQRKSLPVRLGPRAS